MKSGEIDVYAEYTGTLSQVILKTGALAPTLEELGERSAALRAEVLRDISDGAGLGPDLARYDSAEVI